MRNFLTDENKKKLLVEANKSLERKYDSEYIKKVLAVQAYLSDVPSSIIATCFQVSERTVQLWVNRVVNEGYFSLNRKRGSGRPSKLTSEQQWEIDDWIKYEEASFYEPDAKDWTGKILAEAISSELNIEISEKWCRNYIKNGGYKKPEKKAERMKNYSRISRLRDTVSDLTAENKKLMQENKELKQENKELREKLKTRTKGSSKRSEK